MRFKTTPIDGLMVVLDDPAIDHRGAFVRVSDADVFGRQGLPTGFAQTSISENHRAGTLRGMHFQRPPKPEGKLVRCVRGRIYDVAIDLRIGSESYCQWFAIELREHGGESLFIPPGLAHGFLTLSDNAVVLYQISEAYAPELSAGVRWDDPAFGVRWPMAPSIISDRDRAFADYRRAKAPNAAEPESGGDQAPVPVVQ